jgi:site-specific recombinase XerD
MTALAPTVEAFFTQRLAVQRDASPHTVAAYRDTLRLLVVFAHNRTGTPPSRLDVGDIDATLVAAFLTHLETERHNSVSTRNARLTAIHSLFRYAALQHPEHAESIQRVLAIPAKRHQQKLVCFLTREEIDALLSAPDNSTWFGRRDQALLTLAVQTGLRVAGVARQTSQPAMRSKCAGRRRPLRHGPHRQFGRCIIARGEGANKTAYKRRRN